MSTPLVSIIIPAWNAERVLGATLDSVMIQSFPRWEALVVDDCSPDGTAGVIAAYAQRDARIKLLRNPRNSGPAISRNHAIAKASGRYLAFLDADDLWVQDKLTLQLAFMMRGRISFSCTAFRWLNEDGTRVGCKVEVPLLATYGKLLRGNTVRTSSVMIDRDRTGAIQLTDTFYDDYELWLRLAKMGFPVLGLNADLMLYRLQKISFSSNKLKSALQTFQAYTRIQRLGLCRTAWCFGNYAIAGWSKYRSVF